MLIEPGRPEHHALVLALAREAGLGVTGVAELTHSAARLWVAVTNEGTLVGFLLVWEAADELEIHDLAVSAPYRRAGIGRSLVTAAEEYGRSRGTRLLLLEVRSSNHPALSLYGSLGFVPARCRKAYYADGEDAVVMQRALDSSALDAGAPDAGTPDPGTLDAGALGPPARDWSPSA